METPVTVHDSRAGGAGGSARTKATWKDYIDITKPGILRSNLLVTLTGFWLASGWINAFSWTLLILVAIGTTLVMAGSCVLNNFLDRDLDILMDRTKKRAIPEGRIPANVAFNYGIALIVLGTITLAYGANTISALLGIVGAFIYVVVYTAWMKRTTHLNTVVGAISGAMPPIIGWSAVTGRLELGAWALFAFLFLWQIPHFLALAIVKSEDYSRAGYQMLPVTNGLEETKRQILIWTGALVPVSVSLYSIGIVGKIYFAFATVLGIGWLILAVQGFFTKDVMKWARFMFFYSIVYLMVLCIVMMVNVL